MSLFKISSIALLLFVSTGFAEAEKEKVSGAPPETKPATIDQYQKSDSVAPNSKTAKPKEDRNSKPETKSPEERSKYADQVETRISDWGKKIDGLRTQAEKDTKRVAVLDTAIFLEKMREQARADLKEIKSLETKIWSDVQARLEARFQKMDKEYKKAAKQPF